MTGVLFGIIEVGATFLEFFFGLRINGSIGGVKEAHAKKCVIASVLLLLIIQFLNQYSLFSVLAAVPAILGMAVAAMMIYHMKPSDSVIVSTFYVALLYMIDFMMISIWGIVLKNSDFGIEVVQTYSVYRALYIVCCKVLLVGIYWLLTAKIIPSFKIGIRKMLVGAIVCFVLALYFGNLTFEHAGTPMLVLWIVFLLTALSGFYLLSEYYSWKQAKTKYELAIEKNAMIAFSYEELSEHYKQRQHLYHDMNNHYVAIRGYLEHGEYDKAIEYMNSLDNVYDKDFIKWTGMNILDVLLNYKVSIAAKENINIDILSDQIELPLSEQEITALFGNALDNAIEACRKTESNPKWINVNIRRSQDMTFIKISNPFVSVTMDAKGNFLTTKENKLVHGLGMTGMKSIVEKYGGLLSSKVDKGVFSLEVAFFC